MRNQSTPIAVEGFPFIAAAALVAFVFALLSWKVSAAFMAPAVFMVVVTVFIVFFFRNPKRNAPGDENAVLAPADGVVIYLGDAYENHLQSEMTKVSIFMSVFNVHINRVPISGRVCDTFYKKGKFLDVRNAMATFENEQSGLIVENNGGVKMVVVQVAGLIARRIVCYAVKGDTLQRGKIYGLIRFGSRLDVYLPKNISMKVAVGDRTVAGETILGILP